MGKLFSHADEFYLCGLTYSALDMHKSAMTTCHHVIKKTNKWDATVGLEKFITEKIHE